MVGDVAGHGVEAALLMTTVRTYLRLHADPCGPIAEMVSAANRHLAADVLDSGRFMTLFALQIPPKNHPLTWVRAGHEPALIYDPKTDIFQELKGDGMALGLDPDYRYIGNLTEPIRAGQVITIGTDGIWEANNRLGAQYGIERFLKIVRQNAHREAVKIIDAVYEDLKKFSYGVNQADDITLVVIKCRDPGQPAQDWEI
jgi:sigma-B regulation protein RsbU (phosphoserine phosphatase)